MGQAGSDIVASAKNVARKPASLKIPTKEPQHLGGSFFLKEDIGDEQIALVGPLM